MGLAGWFKTKFKPEKEEETDDLVGKMEGAEFIPKIVPADEEVSTRVLSPKKLNRRLEIIDNHIRKLEKNGDPNGKLTEWLNLKEKVKAMLWIYYDIN